MRVDVDGPRGARARASARARARARRAPALSPTSSTRAPLSDAARAARVARARAQFIELKNTNAAIEAYRRAVDVSPRDYRAWYGLGQTYEIIGMHFYALHYYQKATTLRPYDSRMWVATAACYEKLERWADAIRAYEVRGWRRARARGGGGGWKGFRPARRARVCVCA